MKKSEEVQPFSERSRQSPVALLLLLIRLIRGSLGQFWPILLVLFINPKDNLLFRFALFGIAIAAISTIGSMLAYFRFYFHVEKNELVLEKGVLRKSRLNIPFDRIQSIQFEQNVIHSFFNVVSLTIDTAGSQEQEFSITALSRERAEALRTYLMEQKAEKGLSAKSEQETEGSLTPPRRTLMRLNLLDLIKVGVSQNHLRTAGILIAIALGVLNDLEEVIGQSIPDMVESALGIEQSTLFTSLLIGAVFLLIVSFFVSLILTTLRHFNLHVYETAHGFKVDAGLLNRKEQSAPLQKIQYIKWSSSPISRLFQMFTIRLYQAGGQTGSRSSIQIPGSYEQHVNAVRSAYFPEASSLENTVHRLSPLYQVRRFLITGIIPTVLLILLGIFSWQISWYSLLFMLYLPLAYWWSIRVWKSWQLQVNEKGMLTISGIIRRDHTSLQWHKIQSVSIRQSIYQRRHEVGDIIFHTAAGTTRIPFLPIEKANQLRNYCIYFVESSSLAWI